MARNFSSRAIVLEVLRKDNYANWSVCVKNYLLSQDLWDIVEETTEPPKEKDDKDGFKRWRKSNATALHAIQISCGPEILSQVRKFDTAKSAWNALAMMYGEKLRVNLVTEQGMADSRLQYMHLHKYVESGDWYEAKKIIYKNPEAVCLTSSSGRTALHIAVIARHEAIVEELVRLMPKQALEVRDVGGYTALALAANLTGITKMARCMVRLNDTLVSIKAMDGSIPIVLASGNGYKEMTRYLYTVTPSPILYQDNSRNGALLLSQCISNEIFDVALDLLQDCKDLQITLDFDGLRPLCALAQTPSAFQSGSWLAFWQQWIYSCLHIRAAHASTSVNYEKLPGIKKIYSQKQTHAQALEILLCFCRKISGFDESQLQKASAYEAMLEAAKHGIVEFIIEMTRVCPDLLWVVDEDLRGIFSHAILCRREKIFNYIFQLKGSRQLVTSHIDAFDNNMLHLAGMLAPSSELDLRPGAALQMQRELQWFKAVESIVPRKCKEALNIDGKKPRELFSQNHEDLRKEGEKWAKETASSFTIVGTLIITIMFSAAFTVPGGSDQNTGTPFYLNHMIFTVFIISDAMSLCASSTSVLMFLGILTSRYAEEDFLNVLPTKLLIGLSTLFFSVVTMMISFCAALSIVVQGELHIVTVAIVFSSIPVIIFVPLHLPLFAEIFNSTFRPEILNRKMN
ncbi:uncharacterized protein LOC115990975 [Quercus lobata]|uniref:uncharacterized protein LOC115990975 n=1 Tax=Quercus lobata TaxID=97700 RepID=UPI00124928C8|nr:uncharacterized protein LOC115990975 [Quercus lobata]XP_030970603.1 uncharacterized protein LOC115990975 [Quercus lobata]